MGALCSSALLASAHSCHLLGTLWDTDIPVTMGTELCPRWCWPGREKAIRAVGSQLPWGGCCGQSTGRGAGNTPPVSMVGFGFSLSICSLSSAPNPGINFKIYYGSHTEATACRSFCIFLTYFPNKFPVGAGVPADV